jgi:hypothetical protein
MAATYQPPQWLVPNMGPGNINKVGNYSFQFDSAGTQDIQATKDLSSLTECSISCWVKFDFTETSYQYACMVGNTAAAGGMLDIAKQNTTGGDANKFYVWDGATAHTTTKVAADKTWYHAVVTQTGTTIKVYIDTVEVSGGGFTGSALNLDNGATKPTITFGAYYNGSSYNHELEGELSEVSIYDYALSPGDITTLYGSAEAGVGNPMALASPPIAYYKGDKAGFGDQWAVPNQVNYDQVFDFDSGSNQYIDVGTVESINNASKYTIAFWGKKDGATDRLDVASKITTTNRLLLNWSTSGNVNFAPNNGATGLATSALAHDTEWHHFAGVFDGTVATTDRCILYIDGVLAAQTLSGIPTALSATAGTAFEIGAQGGTNFANGEISNVVLFDTNLPATGTESIEALYNNGTPNQNIGSWSNLQGWWKLNQSATWNGSNWNIPDDSTNSNNGTSSNMTQANLVSTTLARSTSDSNYSFSFDGATDYIDIIDSAVPPAIFQNIGDNNSYSISAWIKTAQGTLAPGGWYSADTIVELRQEGGAADMKLPFNFGVASDKVCFGRTADYLTNPETVLSTTSVNNYEWRHVAIVIVDDAYTFYVDGIADGTGTFSAATGDCSVGANTSNMQIGVRSRDGGQKDREYFQGFISNLAIWSSELSAANITTIYNNGKPGDLTSLSPIVWWKLGDDAFATAASPTAWTIPDQIGSNDGTSAGNPDISGDAPESTANGLSENMTIEDRIGESGQSDSNAQSYNMATTARIAYT